METTKPRVVLIGRDGNAVAILAACRRAATDAGWTKEEITAFLAEATSDDYDHLLETVMEHFEVA